MSEKILIVDDEEYIRDVFRAFLEEVGYEVWDAGNYNEARGIIERSEFDLIIADIILGGKSGVDLLKLIEEKDYYCPVVMITGAPSLDTAYQAVRHAAYDYIPKPITQRTLLRVARMALDRKRLIDEREKYRSNLEAIFSGIRDAIVMVDTEMTIVETNENVKNSCGFTRNEIIGNRLDSDDVCECGDCIKIFRDTIRERATKDFTHVECKRKGFTKRGFSISTSPLVSSKGKLLGAVGLIRDETRLIALERELKERSQLRNIVGRSRKMMEIYEMIERLADVSSTVLVTGESGTGKELVSQAIHYTGLRSNKPFITVNCSALPDTLLESELFGHAKGSFTGAVCDRVGRFQKADGGTIFLDEIGDISNALQLRLLRVLQNKEIERVGDSAPVKIDVRIIAATNRNLPDLVKSGKFREDLFYRLKVIEINIPPLSERREDIPILVEHLLRTLDRKLKKKVNEVSSDVMKGFMVHKWPGNVRELENVLEHALIVCDNNMIDVNDLPKDFLSSTDIKTTSQISDADNEKKRILSALEKSEWKKTVAADLLNISRRTLYRKMEQYDIQLRKNDQ